MENDELKGIRVSCSAIDPYIERKIPKPTERLQSGRNMVEWGDRNLYPEYLLALSKETATLHTVINGTVDYITGDDVSIQPLNGATLPGVMNRRSDTIRGQVEDIARDFMTYGGFALQVIRSFSGAVAEVYYTDIRFIRSNKENTVFYYSEKWKDSRRKVIEYPAFYPFTSKTWAALTPEERNRHSSSILFVKNSHTQTYPEPIYCAAVKACETERGIDDYHLNAIENGFESSMIINFNNGLPSDEIKKEIEKDVNEKFSGHQNAGRIMLSWNDNKDTATTFETPKLISFGERYKALANHCRQQIFTAFRANPNLFGIPTESLGFSQEEYESAFRLFNRTVVRPIQQRICDAYDRIYSRPQVLTITPFSLGETSKERKVE